MESFPTSAMMHTLLHQMPPSPFVPKPVPVCQSSRVFVSQLKPTCVLSPQPTRGRRCQQSVGYSNSPIPINHQHMRHICGTSVKPRLLRRWTAQQRIVLRGVRDARNEAETSIGCRNKKLRCSRNNKIKNPKNPTVSGFMERFACRFQVLKQSRRFFRPLLSARFTLVPGNLA